MRHIQGTFASAKTSDFMNQVHGQVHVPVAHFQLTRVLAVLTSGAPNPDVSTTWLATWVSYMDRYLNQPEVHRTKFPGDQTLPTPPAHNNLDWNTTKADFDDHSLPANHNSSGRILRSSLDHALVWLWSCPIFCSSPSSKGSFSHRNIVIVHLSSSIATSLHDSVYIDFILTTRNF